MINLSASPTLGCGINTGKYLFIATQHPNICFPLSHAHILAACQMLSLEANVGTLLSAKAGEGSHPACRICYKYARISGNLMSRCTRVFLFRISELPPKHSSAPHICLSIYIHVLIIFYTCVCICIYVYVYIYPPTFTYVGIHSAGNDNLDAVALIMHKSDVCRSDYVAHDAVLTFAYTHIHLFSICLVMNTPVYRCA